MMYAFSQFRLEPSGQVMYTDLDSTNGSSLDNEDIDANDPQPLRLKRATRLYIGSSKMDITIRKSP